MTRKELIIKQLQERQDGVLINFMCPYIPGEEGAHCTDLENAMWHTHCKDCMKEWIDREAK